MISACLIVRDEAYEVRDIQGNLTTNIERCLQSIVNKVDEIIVVDTGSTDSTIEVCKRYTPKVYVSELAFGENFKFDTARNEAVSKATGDWILIIDADEEIVEPNMDVFRTLSKNENCSFCFLIDDYRAEGIVQIPSRPRLVKKENLKIVGCVHNQIKTNLTEVMIEDKIWRHYGYEDSDKRKERTKQTKQMLFRELETECSREKIAYYNFHLGQIFMGEENHPEARKYLKKALYIYEREETLSYIPCQIVGYLHQIAVSNADEAERDLYTRKIRRFTKHFIDIYYQNSIYYYRKEDWKECKKYIELYIKYYGFESEKELTSYTAPLLNQAIINLLHCIEQL